METFYNFLVANSSPPLFNFAYFTKFELHSQRKGCFKASADQRVHSYPVSDYNLPLFHLEENANCVHKFFDSEHL